MRTRGAFFTVLSAILFGITPAFAKWIYMDGVNASTLVFFRNLFAIVPLYVLCRWQRCSFRIHVRQGIHLVLAAVVGQSVTAVMLYTSYQYIPIATATTLHFFYPVFITLICVILFRERLTSVKLVALIAATLGVAWLAWASPRFPWVALVLAASFGIYSLVKKRTHLAPTEGMLLETALIAVPALAVLAGLGTQGELAFGHGARGTDLLLISTGLMTTVPLVAFAYAAQRLDLATLGMLQYLSPTLQFLLGVFVLHEPMDARRLAGFAAVWAGLAVFSAGKWARGRAVAPAAPSA